MTSFDDPKYEGNYASDRNLLLQEIRVLGGEVARLRGDTKYLSDVVVPREEQRRRLRHYLTVAGIITSIVLAALAGFGYLLAEVRTGQDNLRETVFAACQARNATAQQQAKAVVEINALLGTLRVTEAELVEQGDPALRQIREQRVAAYDRYLGFVEESMPRVPTAAPPCGAYLR